MIDKLYQGKNRLVGVDIWRGIAVLMALGIHYYHKANLPIWVAVGDFFEGYFSIGVVFVGVAGIMGWLKYEREVVGNFRQVWLKHWRKAGELLLVYWAYILLIRFIRADQIIGLETFWLGDPYFMGIFIVLAMVYLAAPFLLWLMKKTGGGWTIGGWAVFWLAIAEVFISRASGQTFWGNWWYNHWRNTVPILPMFSIYCLGALVAWRYKAGKLTPKWQRAVWWILICYPLFRYGLNAKDIYPNNFFWFRALMFIAAATAALSFSPGKNLKAGWKWLAFIGSGSFWVFTAGNFIIALLPNKPVISSWPGVWQWLLGGVIIMASVMVLAAQTWQQSKRHGR